MFDSGDEQPPDGPAQSVDVSALPLAFDVIMRERIWPHGEGVVHNGNDPCSNAPESRVATDLHTVPGDGKHLCSDCEWPENATEALHYDE